MSFASAVSLQPSPFLSNKENRQADAHVLESLQKRYLRLQGYIQSLEQRLVIQAATLQDRISPEKTLEQDINEKIQKFREESKSVQAKICQIEFRIWKIHKKIALPTISPENKEDYRTLKEMRAKCDSIQKIYLALEKAHAGDISLAKNHLKKLPLELRKSLEEDVQKYHPSKKKTGSSWGHNTLEATPRLAVTLQNEQGVPLLKVYLDQMVAAQEEIEDRLLHYFTGKANAFSKCVETGQFSHEILENCFKSLEPEVQELVLHKPPYFGVGLLARQHEELGAHMNSDGSVSFSVFAPNAKEISLMLPRVGEDELEETVVVEMEKNPITGIWKTTLEGIPAGSHYFYQLKVAESDGRIITRNKIDPYAFGNALHPLADSRDFSRADGPRIRSVVCKRPHDYQWGDQAWMLKRHKTRTQPKNIYELHPLLWKKGARGEVLNWRELAPLIVAHCKQYHFTHIELMGVLDYPSSEAIGCYQVLSFFAPNHRMGTLEDLQYFIDQLHQNNLAIIIDWTPAHFCIDSFGLEQFDGSQLYESRNLIQNDDRLYNTPFERHHGTSILRKSRHPHWNTWEFDFSKEATRNFLYSSADFWLKMHFDAFRVDAVSSMLYLDYGRNERGKHFEFLPSAQGDKINHNAIRFLQNLNAYVHQQYPGALMIAEESTGFGGLTARNGIAFDESWNMGWMNRTLHGIAKSDFGAIVHGRSLSRGDPCVYELGHDEVTSGKKALLEKMSGKDITVQFAKTRNLLAYQFCMPGAKLNMMGNEFAQSREWTYSAKARNPKDRVGVFWAEMEKPGHKGMAGMMKELGRIYKEEDALWLRNGRMDSMEYDHIDKDNAVLAYHRKGSDARKQILCVHNFGRGIEKYRIPLPKDHPFPHLKTVRVLFNSDERRWDGSSERRSQKISVTRNSIGGSYLEFKLPAYSTILLEEIFSQE